MEGQETSINDVSPEAAVKVVKEILDHLAALSKVVAEPVTDTSQCPSYLLDWNHDDTWEAGNENGQALEADFIRNLIRKAVSE